MTTNTTTDWYICPDWQTGEADPVMGCGARFRAEPDHEGAVDCPFCGIFFWPDDPNNKPPEGREEAPWCVWCHLTLNDDGVVLVDTTGGDACGVPTDLGAEHGHCTGYAPDAWGDDPKVCTGCFVGDGHGHP